jgi:hypothetical protein
MNLKFSPPNQRAPRGKLAEVTIQFTDAEGPLLAGLELQGFTIWARADGSGKFLALPGRAYEKDGQKKTYDFLRYQQTRDKSQLENLKTIVLQEYDAWAGVGGAQPAGHDDSGAQLPPMSDDDIPF